ncbi:MAG: hypothetical protein RR555_05525 [Bacteroidales bacterium]
MGVSDILRIHLREHRDTLPATRAQLERLVYSLAGEMSLSLAGQQAAELIEEFTFAKKRPKTAIKASGKVCNTIKKS